MASTVRLAAEGDEAAFTRLVAEHRESMARVAYVICGDAEATRDAVQSAWSIAWQSAGRTPEPWLGPDILGVIDGLAADECPGILVCPCGFVADHLEVLYDLDIEARQRAEARGLMFERTASLSADPTVLGALAARVRAIS